MNKITILEQNHYIHQYLSEQNFYFYDRIKNDPFFSPKNKYLHYTNNLISIVGILIYNEKYDEALNFIKDDKNLIKNLSYNFHGDYNFHDFLFSVMNSKFSDKILRKYNKSRLLDFYESLLKINAIDTEEEIHLVKDSEIYNFTSNF